MMTLGTHDEDEDCDAERKLAEEDAKPRRGRKPKAIASGTKEC